MCRIEFTRPQLSNDRINNEIFSPKITNQTNDARTRISRLTGKCVATTQWLNKQPNKSGSERTKVGKSSVWFTWDGGKSSVWMAPINYSIGNFVINVFYHSSAVRLTHICHYSDSIARIALFILAIALISATLFSTAQSRANTTKNWNIHTAAANAFQAQLNAIASAIFLACFFFSLRFKITLCVRIVYFFLAKSLGKVEWMRAKDECLDREKIVWFASNLIMMTSEKIMNFVEREEMISQLKTIKSLICFFSGGRRMNWIFFLLNENFSICVTL